MKSLSLDLVRQDACLLFECLTGSRAYGTHTPESDHDLRGVFILPRDHFFSFEYTPQISDDTNDETYYEIGRFIQLLTKSNPNILEMLYSDEECTRFQHPLFDLIQPELVLSKQCESTFAGYAITQLQKARGLNKKIVNPMEGPRKSILEFCYALSGQGSLPLLDWLDQKGLSQLECGLVNIPHMRDVYAIFTGAPSCQGIIKRPDATEVSLSSIPKGTEPIGWMSFNKDGYKKYCKDYREYQDWIRNRNEARYATNVSHGRNYDSKNLMHTFRLLDMAEEIAIDHRLTVRRPNVEFLMKIRKGEFAYDDLMEQAEEKVERIKDLFSKSSLRETPDSTQLEEILVHIRDQWYLHTTS